MYEKPGRARLSPTVGFSMPRVDGNTRASSGELAEAGEAAAHTERRMRRQGEHGPCVIPSGPSVSGADPRAVSCRRLEPGRRVAGSSGAARTSRRQPRYSEISRRRNGKVFISPSMTSRAWRPASPWFRQKPCVGDDRPGDAVGSPNRWCGAGISGRSRTRKRSVFCLCKAAQQLVEQFEAGGAGEDAVELRVHRPRRPFWAWREPGRLSDRR